MISKIRADLSLGGSSMFHHYRDHSNGSRYSCTGVARKEIGHFYVPRFEIKIEGVGLPRDILRDVVQVTYKDNIKDIDSFELTVNNWDPDTRNCKYIGSETKKDLEGNTNESRRLKIFEPCQKEVEVRNRVFGRS